MKAWAALGVLAVAGCGGGPTAWWPLPGQGTYSYSLERGASTVVADWKVTGRAPVGRAAGYIVSSPVGSSVLAWDGGRLVASQLAGTRFSPPIPILVEGEETWRGSLVTAGNAQNASAQITGKQGEDRHPVFGVRTLEVVAKIQTKGKVLVVESVFADRIGLVSQSQRTNDVLDYRLTLLGSG